MKRTRLFTTAFPEGDAARRAEFAECLLRNLACSPIDEVCVLVEGSTELPRSEKILQKRIDKRPDYADYFRWIADVAGPDDLSIIANADIYFDSQIGAISARGLPPKCVLALSRWDITSEGEAVLNDRNDSQDAWVFRGAPMNVKADFPIGVPRCDNRFAKELELAGYRVLNPSFSIRAYHLHSGARAEYQTENETGFVEGPYGYVWPHNLLPLPQLLWHNSRNRDFRLGWHFDKRYWSRTLKFHWAGRLLRVLSGGKP